MTRLLLAALAWSGFVDAAYHVDFTGDAPSAPFACYTPAGNTFVLHSAHLALAHAFSDALSATIELDAGYDAAKTAAYPFNGIPFDVQEAYATYRIGQFSLIAGKFAGNEGLEVIEGPLNPTITRGYSFNMAEPNTHTGLRVHFTTDQLDVGLGLVNGWDTLLDNNTGKTIIAKLGVTPNAAFNLNLNGTFGPELEDVDDVYRLSLDLDAVWSLRDAFELRLQANYGMDGIGTRELVRWYVLGAQSVYENQSFKLGARAEFFADPDGARAGLGSASLLNLTLTPGVVLASRFELRAELRGDFALRGHFAHARRALASAALAAAYVF